ncbi:MAG TPA: HPF/RaiA family ribosome-associated protein [Stellaceae bacterium]|nr:HPF/RaiA family ribosome-associated protein [Stellaceae bacterium]
METPLEIVFHNMPSSPEVEAEIREQVGKLERRFGRLTSCRVAVEQLHRQHQTGNIYDVHITMRVPRDELVVSREPHRPKEKYAEPDIRVSLRDAFKAAERQLTEYKRKLKGEVKPHEESFAGQIAQLYPAEDHGFILTHEGTQLYFHRNSLINGEFRRLQVGDRVHFVETVGDTGPIASKVWPAGEPG